MTGTALLLNGVGAVPAGGHGGTPASLPPVHDPLYGAPIADPDAIPRFVNPLPRPPRIHLLDGGTLSLAMAQTTQDIIGGGRGLNTPVWGFGQPGDRSDEWTLPVSSPGPTIVARTDQTVEVEWLNSLPFKHLLPLDDSIHWAFTHGHHTVAEHGVPAVVHLHGGHNEARNDGHPDAWYTATGATGPRFDGTTFRYENHQEGGTLWYHEHTHGLARLGIYAGLSGFYLLRDDRELALIDEGRLPSGPYELELVIQDRAFHPNGRLAYPTAGAGRHDRSGTRLEHFGHVVVVNGKAWPYLEVEPRQYRFRLLNASNSRFFRLSIDGQWPFPVHLIGTDGGLLRRPYRIERALMLAPSERADIVMDFGKAKETRFELTNDAATPFPRGNPVVPPADKVLQFRVTKPYDSSVAEPSLPGELRDAPYRISAAAAETRRLLITRTRDEQQRLKPMLGTVEQGALSWSDPVTERPRVGKPEIWEIFNTTGDAHAIHLHLVQFLVLDESPFTADEDPETGALSNIRIDHFEPPAPTERGPKDTVRVRPHHVIRIKAVFDRPGEFVWHCHMQEHEDHQMMRGFTVS